MVFIWVCLCAYLIIWISWKTVQFGAFSGEKSHTLEHFKNWFLLFFLLNDPLTCSTSFSVIIANHFSNFYWNNFSWFFLITLNPMFISCSILNIKNVKYKKKKSVGRDDLILFSLDITYVLKFLNEIKTSFER